jgi:predicted dehydrogenase
MDKIQWGIIGCGAVTEKKSGPAFNKVPNSALVAVMRRNAEKAEDYAKRHGVSRWYSNAGDLIEDKEVNAIYIATPPDSHEQYIQMALEAGKPVYVEKPMTMDTKSAERTQALAAAHQDRVVVAHYRRYWPLFQKVKMLLDEGAIGQPLTTTLQFFRKPLTAEELSQPGVQWRIDPAISGGGLFHDLAPHQLDLFRFFWGNASVIGGHSSNRGGLYKASDMVSGQLIFENGVHFSGQWCFCSAESQQRDICEITGTEGRIQFSVFWENPMVLENVAGTQSFSIEPPEHNQIFMIEEVVRFLRRERSNPCSVTEGLAVQQWMDAFCG